MSDETNLSAEQVAELRRLRDALPAVFAADLANDDVGLEGSASSVADLAYDTALRGAAPALIAAAEERDALRAEVARLRAQADSFMDENARLREEMQEDVDAQRRRIGARDAMRAELAKCAKERDGLRAEVERLRKFVLVSACPNCGSGSDYRREYNGGPCRFVFHDLREALTAPPNQEQPKPGAEACPECEGNMVRPGYKFLDCPACNGTGQRASLRESVRQVASEVDSWPRWKRGGSSAECYCPPGSACDLKCSKPKPGVREVAERHGIATDGRCVCNERGPCAFHEVVALAHCPFCDELATPIHVESCGQRGGEGGDDGR